ncbi:uncharacterized protein LOC109835000 [Asparagus officinalis]|uniref:uncharacterized protein LOC109835000 n=1 Tax=Asparagus officinalis TaxID=4686 RepID=UPI00098E169B|nr:uncharacterized protein LOC109835000 [Asparagus officinalis]
MAPNKDWMDLVDDDRLDPKYKEGVDQFLDYAYEKLLDSFNEKDEDFEIRCPCIKCSNVKSGNRELVKTHLIVHGIIKNYRFWCHHDERQGESISEFDEEQEEMTEESQSDDEMQEMIGDLFHNSTGVVAPDATSSQDILEQEPDGHAKQFYSLLESDNHRVQSDDAILNESRQEADNSQRKKNPPRGSNKCLKLNNLSHGEKKIITFYQNRAIEPEFSRYLGIIIRDRNICPVAVENWAKIPQQNKDHMWASIKDKFDADDMEQKRESVMRHLRDLWNKWRGDMHRKYVKENSLQVALRNKPTEDEIVQVKQANPSLSDIEIVEKIWGKQSHGHITVFGGGTTLKDLRGPFPS